MLALVLLALPAVACDADALDAAAAKAISDEDYVSAAKRWDEAFACEARPGFLFARGLALRLAGNCEGAIPVLERFKTVSTVHADQEEATRMIAGCEEALSAAPPPKRELKPAPPPELPRQQPPPPTDTQPRRNTWIRDPAGGALGATGIVVLSVGAGFLGAAHVQAEAPDLTQDEYDDTRRRTRTFAAVGITALVVGGALVIASAIRYGLVARRLGRAPSAAVPLRVHF